jgi:hypothetical protein
LLLSLLFSECRFGSTDYCLVLGAFAKGSILRTQSRIVILAPVDCDSLGSVTIDGGSLDEAERNCLYTAASWFGDFMKIEVICEHRTVLTVGMVRQFLVEIFVV